MFRNFALVMLALTATAVWSASSEACGHRCGGHHHHHCGGCGNSGCGNGGCNSGCASCGAAAPACGTCAAAPSGCPGGVCSVNGPVATVAAAPTAAPGYVVVNLPAGSRLTIDDKPTSAIAETRTFVTPQIQPGYVYTYTLKADIVRDGKVEQVTKKVSVTAGQELKVSLTVPAEVVAAK